jgi:hypothetical protein
MNHPEYGQFGYRSWYSIVLFPSKDADDEAMTYGSK